MSEDVRHFAATTFFGFSSRCSTCNKNITVDLFIFSNSQHYFKEVSMVSRNSEVKIAWGETGAPEFVHRSCGGKLLSDDGRTIE